jgi:hypothetical protein
MIANLIVLFCHLETKLGYSNHRHLKKAFEQRPWTSFFTGTA